MRIIREDTVSKWIIHTAEPFRNQSTKNNVNHFISFPLKPITTP